MLGATTWWVRLTHDVDLVAAGVPTAIRELFLKTHQGAWHKARRYTVGYDSSVGLTNMLTILLHVSTLFFLHFVFHILLRFYNYPARPVTMSAHSRTNPGSAHHAIGYLHRNTSSTA